MSEQDAAEVKGLQEILDKVFDKMFGEKKVKDAVMSYVGGGSMSEGVFKVESKSEGNFYAIKRVPKAHISPEKAELDKTLREIGILSKLRHPSIIQFYTHYETDALVLLAMEYFDGQQLDRYVPNTNSTPVKYKEIMDCVLSALHHAHTRKGPDGKGFVHLDIKPDNILVKDNGKLEVRLIDFGLSRKENTKGSTSSSVGGALGYRAPDCDTALEPDRRMDVFSIGVMMYELFSNDLRGIDRVKRPSLSEHLSSKRFLRTLHKLDSGDLKEFMDTKYAAKDFPGGNGGAIDKIIHRCIDFNPGNRYATAEAVRIDLNLAFKPKAVSAVYESLPGATTPVGALKFIEAYKTALGECNALDSLEYVADSILMGNTVAQFKECRKQVARAVCTSIYDRLVGSPASRQNAVNKCIANIKDDPAGQEEARAYFAEAMKPGRKLVENPVKELDAWKKFFDNLSDETLSKIWNTL